MVLICDALVDVDGLDNEDEMRFKKNFSSATLCLISSLMVSGTPLLVSVFFWLRNNTGTGEVRLMYIVSYSLLFMVMLDC